MRNTPSFIGEFSNKQKPKTLKTTRSSELPIEKEADLREKRKQILQRLKHKNDHDNIDETVLPPRSITNDEISEKIVFSPRTAKRFEEAGHKRLDVAEIKRLCNRQDMPKIVLQEPMEKHQHHTSKNEDRPQEIWKDPSKTAAKDAKQSYIPSFANKSPPLRKAQASPGLSKRTKTSPKLSKKIDAIEEKRSKEKKTVDSPSQKHDGKSSNMLPLQKPPLLTSSSLEISDNDVESLPLRRSASYQSLKERGKSRKSGGRKFLEVENATTSSLSSIDLQSTSATSSIVNYNDLSSTKSLKLQQDKLEEDFHKLEEDLDRAFSELRKYLKTS